MLNLILYFLKKIILIFYVLKIIHFNPFHLGCYIQRFKKVRVNTFWLLKASNNCFSFYTVFCCFVNLLLFPPRLLSSPSSQVLQPKRITFFTIAFFTPMTFPLCHRIPFPNLAWVCIPDGSSEPNAVSWSFLPSGYGKNGFVEEEGEERRRGGRRRKKQNLQFVAICSY